MPIFGVADNLGTATLLPTNHLWLAPLGIEWLSPKYLNEFFDTLFRGCPGTISIG